MAHLLKFLPSITRWLKLLAYASIAATGYIMGGAPTASYVTQRLHSLPVDPKIGDLFVWIICASLIFVFLRLAKANLCQIRHLLRYPPLPIAIVLALAIAPSLSAIVSKTHVIALGESAIALAAFVAIWTIVGLVEIAAEKLALTTRPNINPPDASSFQELSDEKLRAWLKREEELPNSGWDLFDHSSIAERIIERLVRNESTIALQGDFGSGKSTICALTEELSGQRELNLIFVKVSCWGFEDEDYAQRHVLEEMLRVVGQEVDCIEIRQLPSDYIDAMGAQVSWLKSISSLGSRELSPLEQLRRLSPILTAIQKKVVLVIEDVDRTGKKFDVGRIQSLLVQFRSVPGISFIFSVSPLQQVDFAKLCDHVEIVPLLERRHVLRLVHQTRELMLRENRPDVLLKAPDPLIAEDDNYRIFDSQLEYFWPWQMSLCSLLNRPRLLKHCLRRMYNAWPSLSGEVDIDDVIALAALRTGAPSAFSFFCERYSLFEQASKPADKDLRDEARTHIKKDLIAAWNRTCGQGGFDARAAAGILRQIYPSSGAVTGLSMTHRVSSQSMQPDSRRDIYARRLIQERCEKNEISDQHILRLIERSSVELEARAELAEAITDSNFASVAFEHFARAKSFDHHLELLSCVYSTIRKRHGVRFNRDDHPGFYASWRIVGLNRPKSFEDWLVKELTRCIPGHLQLLTNIYYFWLGSDRTDLAKRERSRRAIVEELKKTWTPRASATIAEGFNPAGPYTLFHLIFTSEYEKPDTVPLGRIEDWTWSGPPLLEAAKVAPSVMLPQLCIALNTNQARSSELPKFEFDEAKLNGLFGNKADELVRLVSNGFEIHKDISEQTRYLLGLAVECAKKQSPKKNSRDSGK